MDSADWLQIAVAILCVIAILIAWRVTCRDSGLLVRRSVFYVAIMLGVGNLLILGARRLRPAPDLKLEVAGGELVGAEQTQITVRSLRSQPNQKLWIVVYSFPDRAFYPYPAQLVAQNEWSARIPIGRATDRGQRFEVSAFLVDGSADKDLKAYANDPARAGLLSLPAGGKLYPGTSVVRK